MSMVSRVLVVLFTLVFGVGCAGTTPRKLGYTPVLAAGQAAAASSYPAVLNNDAGNAGYARISDGTAANSATHPILIEQTDGTTAFAGAKETGGNLATVATAVGAGQKASGSSLSVTFPSDKAIAVIQTASDGSFLQVTGMAAVPTGAGGSLLAGATNRRIFSILCQNLSNASTSYVILTLGSPSGTFPNYTNLITALVVGSGNLATSSFFATGIGGGYPIGATALYGVESTSLTSQTNPVNQVQCNIAYGP